MVTRLGLTALVSTSLAVMLVGCGGGNGAPETAAATKPASFAAFQGSNSQSMSVDDEAVQPASVASAQADSPLKIQVLSNRADLISGGDALVEIVGASPFDIKRIDVDGKDVSSAFATRPNGRYQAKLSALKQGDNVVTVRLKSGVGSQITIKNHPIGGPVFAGAQTQPWICQTEAAGLGKPLDAQCNAPAQVTYLYKSTDATKLALQPYDPSKPPGDVATAQTDHAGALPFIVRRERGVIDRGIYEYFVLANPQQKWEPWAPQKGWNGKLYWTFAGDCKPNHVQPKPAAGALAVVGSQAEIVGVLSRGFATAASGMTILGNNCNSVVSAEALMMIKEHITETLGPIRYTMSEGESGGSMQQHWHVSNYPGLLNGIQPSASYPDIWETLKESQDCHLLNRYFTQLSPQLWLLAPQQDAVTGYLASTVCHAWASVNSTAKAWLDPANAPGCALSVELVYNAITNPGGIRCTLQDYMGAIFGKRSSDGFANYPYDNVGVQYGLVALTSGLISAEQFVDMNEKVGGLDIDWKFRPQRAEADPAAIRTMHRAGLVMSGAAAKRVPIIDLRGSANVEIHTDVHSYVTRARLQKANGHSDNQIIWTTAVPLVVNTDVSFGTLKATATSVDLLDNWLSRIEADKSTDTLEKKVIRNKPGTAVDACFVGSQKITDMQKCRLIYPYFSVPRIAAGGPLADDIVKCQLKQANRSDYSVQFSDAQWARLMKAFPDGVCDYTKPGVAQEASIPWLTFKQGAGGQPLGNPPQSVLLGKT